MGRRTRIEVVETDAEQPYHARIVGGNGEIVWTTEKYARRIDAEDAVALLADVVGTGAPSVVSWREVDERTQAPS